MISWIILLKISYVASFPTLFKNIPVHTVTMNLTRLHDPFQFQMYFKNFSIAVSSEENHPRKEKKSHLWPRFIFECQNGKLYSFSCCTNGFVNFYQISLGNKDQISFQATVVCELRRSWVLIQNFLAAQNSTFQWIESRNLSWYEAGLQWQKCNTRVTTVDYSFQNTITKIPNTWKVELCQCRLLLL